MRLVYWALVDSSTKFRDVFSLNRKYHSCIFFYRDFIDINWDYLEFTVLSGKVYPVTLLINDPKEN